MIRVYMFKYFGLFIAAALLLSGCAFGEASLAEQVRAQGAQYSNLADDWDEGERLIREGESFVRDGEPLVDQGNDDIRAGRRLVNRGEDRQRNGRALVARGERLKSEAEAAHARLVPNS